MTSSDESPPISYVKLLREIRDRIGEEIADMTPEERLRWHKEQIQGSPWAMEMLARAKAPPHRSSKRRDNPDE